MHAINGIIAKEKPPGMDRVRPEEPLAVAHWRVKEGGNEGLRADLLLPRAAPMGLANILRAAPILVDVGITHPSGKVSRQGARADVKCVKLWARKARNHLCPQRD